MTSERGWIILGSISAYIFMILLNLEINNPIIMLFACFPFGFAVIGLYGWVVTILKVSKYYHKVGIILFFAGAWSCYLTFALCELGYLPYTSIYLSLALVYLGSMMIGGFIFWKWIKSVYLYYRN